MKQFKVLKPFKDIHSKDVYAVNSEHEVSNARFGEIKQNLKQYDGAFIEEIKPAKQPKKKETPTEEEGA